MRDKYSKNIKAHYSEALKEFSKFSMPPNLSHEDTLVHFGACASANVKVRLEAISDWLDETDALLQEFFIRRERTVAAGVDHFSVEFNGIVQRQVKLWINTDDQIREHFNEYVAAHGKTLKSVEMVKKLDEQFETLKSTMVAHVKKANEYGTRWTKQADTAGLQILDADTRRTIQWFTNLTVKELEREYRRWASKGKR